MLLFWFKLLLLIIFSIFIWYNYFFIFPNHLVNFDWYFPYILTILAIFGIYKYLQYHNNKKSREISISFSSLLTLFVSNVFVLCFYFFSINLESPVAAFSLFFKIIWFSILPILIFLISAWFWKTLSDKFLKLDALEDKKPWILNISIGFIAFIALLTIFWLVWLYNLFIVIWVLGIFSAISHKNILSYIKDIFNIKFVYKKDRESMMKLAITEFFTFIAFLSLWVGLIMIVRPFPIWWDDLWVYMNYPHLLAEAKSLLPLWAMYTWQIFTWIWYLFNSPTQAFFLNISWLFLSFIFLINILSTLIKREDKKTFLPIPIMLSVLFITLPMVIFQTMKDMKVDQGLFFLSITTLYYLYLYYIRIKEDKKIPLLLIFVIWIIVWICFSIKFTTLLLILWILACITYVRIWWIWTLWYIWIFLWVFTSLKLWWLMQVNINPYNVEWLELYSWLSLLLWWIILLIIWILKNKKNFVIYFKEIIIFLSWIVIILLPWFAKNISESYPEISVPRILMWKSDSFVADYDKIYTKDEYLAIREQFIKDNTKEWLSTSNEDLLRYLWYENGLLKHINMFWNLTMQKNQWWEFTDIWFIFLALLPLIFIFLPYKNKYYFLFFVFIATFQFTFYQTPHSKYLDNEQLSKINSEAKQNLLSLDSKVFKNKVFNKDIYDINIKDYYTEKTLWETVASMEETILEAEKLYNKDTNKKDKDYYMEKAIKNFYPILEKQLYNSFYSILEEKVIDPSLWASLDVFSIPLNNKDFEYIKYLNIKYNSDRKFGALDIVDFRDSLNINNLSVEEKEEMLKIWNETRTIPWKITDFFAKINIPIWYIYILIWFLVPVAYLLFTLKDTDLNKLFKLNLVFAALYVLLWLVSSFWIVWYWITMYFSFLLMIWIWLFYISSYKDNDEKRDKYYAKALASVFILIMFLFYLFAYIVPYIFNNLKTAWYSHYKNWTYNNVESVFLSQTDYTKILFELNIKDDKKEKFLKENIDKDIYNQYDFDWIDISEITSILKFLSDRNDKNSSIAKHSLKNIYTWILNPREEYKNKEKIYRAWTFLKYYISENNNRLLEDSLIEIFSYYIYWDSIEETIDRFKKLWVKYVLLDLNTATIDNSLNHNLTDRYESLLYTLSSKDLELISTDSICLNLWLESYRLNGDLSEFLTVASVNHNSYDSSWNIIMAWEKRSKCINKLIDVLDNDLINEKDYSFLLWLEDVFKKYNWDVALLNRAIWGSYKALFKIK